MNRSMVLLYTILFLLLSPLLVSCGARSGVTVTLEPGQTAPLGGTMAFQCTVKYSRDAPSDDGESGAELSVTVSSGLTFLNSNWTLKERRDGYSVYTTPTTFQADVPQTFKFQVGLDQPGTQTVMAGARIFFGDNGDQVGEGATKLLDVSANGTTVRDMPNVWPTDQPTASP